MSTEVSFSAERERYEIHVDGELAGFTQAKEREDGVLVFPHTVVLDAFEGQGLASRLVTEALNDVRAKGRTIDPQCPYVARFVEKHPEYADLVA
ncbi:MAG: GNAT family N-acetyltransferase [Aeromicrobium erythreum]